MSDPIIDALNTMNRHWWTLFNEIEKAIDRGDIDRVRKVCQDAKTNLRTVLKENGQS